MGFVVPLINKDTSEIKEWMQSRLNDPQIQKKMVLVIVSIALLLDNMLYMVIVPIIPLYLRSVGAYEIDYIGVNITLPNKTVIYNKTGEKDYIGEDESLGFLFASKALVQILVNPFSGTLIDRIGYEMPMIIGLVIMFSSTSIFALGQTYGVLFFARSLQGLGSAFADTSGLAMIADRFTEEHERSKALGIALAFISFGCLVAPPFGSILYDFAGKPVPFLALAMVCLIDGFMVFMVIQPEKKKTDQGEKLKGPPIWRLLMDPYIAVCSGALVMANVSLAFLEPTISRWMKDTMEGVTKSEIGLIWLPAFFPHVFGVYLTVVLVRKYPRHPWLLAAIGLAMEGLSCIVVPYTTSFWMLTFPLATICFGIALIDTSILPLLGYLVDTRHVSIYGSVYAIADISYSLAYAFGPIIAGAVVGGEGFKALNMGICVSNLVYVPMLYFLRYVYVYKPFENDEQMINGEWPADDDDGYSTMRGDYKTYGSTMEDGYNQNGPPEAFGIPEPERFYNKNYPQPD